MPTYLIHGFRWYRISIRQYVATYDVEDAAPDWIVTPASSHALLNSLYTLHDFIPPCQQPTSTSLSSSSTATLTPPFHSPTRTTTAPAPAPAPRDTGLSPPRPHLLPRSANGVAASAPPPLSPAERAFNAWSPVKLLEQHDILAPAISEPYAYVGDALVRISLSADIGAEIAAYESRQGCRREGASIGELRRLGREEGWIGKLAGHLEPKERVGWFVVVCGDEERSFGRGVGRGRRGRG
ncbi:hypothetical protein GMDG_03296 [Pseudogymnoascus destructans 20631-21]|uniref:Uncharacterized protein n=1 Tax=Pseudogymnoascus destructans (strain ATCC MYA-4855 / 20631-21) TaxID=658429 RepID=L8G5V0_PSED2|nr:hypothetical protein GMDG_03296 [Pseudogymnoascus destructans 20631-21]